MEQFEAMTPSKIKDQVFEASIAATSIADKQGCLLHVNPAFLDAWGFEQASDVVGQPISAFFADPQQAIQILNILQISGKWIGTFLALKKDGSQFLAKGHATTLVDSDGKIIGYQSACLDITEQDLAEGRLRESERALLEAQSIAGLGSYILDIGTGVWRASSVLEDIFGIDASYPRTIEGWVKIVHPDWQEQMSAYFANEVLGKGLRFDKEYKVIRQIDGKTLWVHGKGALEFNLQKQPIRMIGTIIDITERKRIEEALVRVNERFSMAVDSAGIGVWEWDVVHNELTWDDGMYRLYQIKPSDFSGAYDAWQAGLHPEDRERGHQAILQGLSGAKQFDTEFRIVWPSGEVRILRAFAKVVRNFQGTPLRMIGINLDITDRKSAEVRVQDSEEKFRALFSSVSEGIALHELIEDASGTAINYRIIDTNPAYQTHTGLGPKAVIGKLGTEIYGTPKAPFLSEFAAVAKTRVPLIFETYFPPMEKHFRISVVSPKPRQFATVFEDITEQKRKEAELQRHNEEMSRFLYTVSHDLKSPLVTIKAFLGYIEQDIGEQNPEALAKDIGFINNAANKMGNLLDELLELSRIGRKPNPLVEVSLQTIITQTTALVAGRIAQSKARVEVTEKPVILFGDEQRLVELFQNLVENSIKFMGSQSEPCIEIGCTQENQQITIYVRDNGSGIDPRYQSKVFGLFEKLEKSTDGVGMGLAIVQRIVEVHGGKIWIESKGEGQGTTFFLTLAKTRIG